MANLYCKGGGWLVPNYIYAKSGGAWRTVQAVYRNNGGSWIRHWPNVTPGSASFTTPGSYGFVVPRFVTVLIASVYGAGGGGGGAYGNGDVHSGGSGGSGGYYINYGLSVTAGEYLTISVGAGGGRGIWLFNGNLICPSGTGGYNGGVGGS